VEEDRELTRVRADAGSRRARPEHCTSPCQREYREDKVSSEAILSKHEIIELLRLAGREREREYRARHAAARLTPRELEVLRAVAEHLNVTIVNCSQPYMRLL
jgi:hypothetical protein